VLRLSDQQFLLLLCFQKEICSLKSQENQGENELLVQHPVTTCICKVLIRNSVGLTLLAIQQVEFKNLKQDLLLFEHLHYKVQYSLLIPTQRIFQILAISFLHLESGVLLELN